MVIVLSFFLLLTSRASNKWSARYEPLAKNHHPILATVLSATYVTSTRFFATITTKTTFMKSKVFISAGIGHYSTGLYMLLQTRGPSTKPCGTPPLMSCLEPI